MNEETARRVMLKYFEYKRMKPIPQRGAGPDIIIDGTAVEVKGSDVQSSRNDVRRMLRQIVDYMYKYKRVSLAIPIDGLNLEIAHQLETLAMSFVYNKGKILDIYVILDTIRNDKTFYVLMCTSPTGAVSVTGLLTMRQISLNENDTLETAMHKFEPLFNYESPKYAIGQPLVVPLPDGSKMTLALGGATEIEI